MRNEIHFNDILFLFEKSRAAAPNESESLPLLATSLWMSTDLNKKIADLEARVTKYEIELDSSSSSEARTEIDNSFTQEVKH